MSIHASPALADDLARIGYQTILAASNVSATTPAAGYTAAAVANPATYERYKPNVLPASIVCDASALTAGGTNLLTYAEAFDDVAWSVPVADGSITADTASAPNGTTTADKLVEASGAGLYPQAARSVAVVSGTVYTLSFYCKAAERSSVRLLLDDGVTSGSAWFNLSAGTVGTESSVLDAAIEDAGDGWYRCAITRQAGSASLFCQALIGNPGETTPYTGDGTSGLYLWGAKLERGTAATDYKPLVDYVGIAAHTLGSLGCTAYLESSPDNATWTTQLTINPADDSTIMGLIDPVMAPYWRLRVTGVTAPVIGVVYLGKLLTMQRPIYGGHTPLNLARITAVRPSLSETGQWLGASQERKGFKTGFAWRHLTAAWYRENFDPFVATNPRVKPFFIAWRPYSFPDEVGYCWATGDIAPSNSGIRDFMEVSMDVEGFSDRA